MRRSSASSFPCACARWLLVCGAALFLGRLALSSTTPADGEAKKALCAYHLMQLGRAIAMYANDHDGYICPLRGRPDWQWKEGPGNAERLKAAYAPYIQDPEIWYCPADPYAHTHTRQGPEHLAPADQPDMACDHYYVSYRHYAWVRGETPPVRLDAVLAERDEMTSATNPGGAWTATPDMIMLMMDDGQFHGTPLTGQYGAVYARNVLFRDGHVKFETEETMRRPK